MRADGIIPVRKGPVPPLCCYPLNAKHSSPALLSEIRPCPGFIRRGVISYGGSHPESGVFRFCPISGLLTIPLRSRFSL